MRQPMASSDAQLWNRSIVMSKTTRKAGTYYVILISGAAALGGFLFGFDTGRCCMIENRDRSRLEPG
jgi:hypothetical protein